MFESLEHRKLFAVTLRDGILEVVGTDDNDRIVIRRGTVAASKKNGEESNLGSLIDVSINGQRKSFHAYKVLEMRIAGGAGNDSIRDDFYSNVTDGHVTVIEHGHTVEKSLGIFYEGPKVRIDGGDGNDAISGSLTSETLVGSSGNDTIFAGEGKDLLQGGDGDDVLYSGGGGPDRLYGGARSGAFDAGNDHFFIQSARVRLGTQLALDTVEVRRSGVALDLDGKLLDFRPYRPVTN